MNPSSAPPFSPAQHPPPIKKQRAGGTPPTSSKDGAEAMAARRARLDAMKNRMASKTRAAPLTGIPPPTPAFVPTRSPRSAAASSLPSNKTTTQSAKEAPQPTVPQQQHQQQQRAPMVPQRRVEIRKSDIFPSAPKSDTTADKETLAAMAAATPGIARRLDESLSKQAEPNARSASAPPVRPPPPPPGNMTAAAETNAPPSMPPQPSAAPPMFPRVATAVEGENPTSNPPNPFAAGRSQPAAPAPAPAMPPTFSLFQPNPSAAEKPASTTTAVTDQAPPAEPEKKVTISDKVEVPPSPEVPPLEEEGPELTQTEEPEETSFSQPTKAFAGGTPFPAKPAKEVASTPYIQSATGDATTSAPPTARRDVLRNMHAIADSPQKPPESTYEKSAELRMQQELAQAQKEKASALRAVAELNAELEKAKAEAAKAKESSNVGFMSPLAPSTLPLSPQGNPVMSPLAMMSPRTRRVPTPHPKRTEPMASPGGQNATAPPEGTSALLPFLKEASTLVPFEFESGPITFVLRRPYGTETNQDLWFSCGQVGAKIYVKNAHVETVDSIEVVALIPADGSRLVVHGKQSVRHGSRDGSWQEFPDDQETPLGSVTYIDSEANEQEYSLDSIFEGALIVREHYCNSLLTTAIGLQRKGSMQPTVQPAMMMKPQEVPAKAPVADVKQESAPRSAPEHKPREMPPVEPQKPQLVAPPPPVEDDNVMGIFMGMVVSFFFQVFIVTPFRIITTFVVYAFAMVLIALAWMYLAEQNGVLSLGGTTPPGRMFNPPGIM